MSRLTYLKIIKIAQFLAIAITLLFYSCQQDQTSETETIQSNSQQQQTSYQDDRVAIELREKERIQAKLELEKQREEENLYNQYINNSLSTGSLPYLSYYGSNSSCNDYGCSQIKVKTPANSDVLVTIKKNGEVVRHAYIKAMDSYTFSFPNGKYQAFFYYGKGWNPSKLMKNGTLKGGFIEDEHFGKDEAQYLENNILEYELILQQNGNFSTKPSNPEEAL